FDRRDTTPAPLFWTAVNKVRAAVKPHGPNVPDVEYAITARQILDVLVEYRQWTYERALIELAFGLDMVGPGRYRALRRQIGEPADVHATAMQNSSQSLAKPRWDRAEGQLWLGDDIIRMVRIRRTPSRVQRLIEAFERARWKKAIESPFADELSQDGLHGFLNDVNDGLKQIRFHGRAGGRELTWSYVTEV
ncbi:MAG: hypothetical protein WD738_12505, partial [Pirellulales bacterium]